MQRIRSFCANFGQILLKIGAISAFTVAFSGCQPASDSVAAVAAEAPVSYLCGEDGHLSTQLFGALEDKIEWSAADLECEGMARPEGDGARLRFAGRVDDERTLAFIISLPELRPGETGTEYQSNVTLIEEGNGRFFSTADIDICWTDIVELESVSDADSSFAVTGNLYCVAPLTEVNGDSDVSVRDLRFRGLLDWNAS